MPAEDKLSRRQRIRRHVAWLIAAAVGVYASYIFYIFVWSRSV